MPVFTPSLAKVWVDDPDSEGIARILTRVHATTCRHGRDPCYLRCGVRLGTKGRWVIILHAERIQWLEGIHRNLAAT